MSAYLVGVEPDLIGSGIAPLGLDQISDISCGDQFICGRLAQG
jgi:hypothetical protein